VSASPDLVQKIPEDVNLKPIQGVNIDGKKLVSAMFGLLSLFTGFGSRFVL
jgi:hypothetical protein